SQQTISLFIVTPPPGTRRGGSETLGVQPATPMASSVLPREAAQSLSVSLFRRPVSSLVNHSVYFRLRFLTDYPPVLRRFACPRPRRPSRIKSPQASSNPSACSASRRTFGRP